MLFSKGCTYAIRAALLVAVKETREGRKFIPIRELADELDLSFHFLTKILQVLTEAEIMESFRRPNVGIGLAREANKECRYSPSAPWDFPTAERPSPAHCTNLGPSDGTN
ncbi:MAG: Rrf2 family transcriptional regulator [bacterium]|nr:Rrf2 family transcriptional regulator [bacterium]